MAKKGSTDKPSTKEWAKHLRPKGKRDAAKAERTNSKKDIKERLHENVTIDSKKKFENFLENLKNTDNEALIESVKTGFKACFESDADLEHTIGNYYYDSRAGKYYDKSSDMYVDADVVNNMLNAQQRSGRVNNEVLGQAFKLGLIDGRDYQKNHSRVMWDDNMMNKMFRNAKNAGINVTELFEKAKAEFS